MTVMRRRRDPRSREVLLGAIQDGVDEVDEIAEELGDVERRIAIHEQLDEIRRAVGALVQLGG